MINQIIKSSKKFQRKTGGVPTFEKAREYIKRKGYTVILFDIEDTEEVYTYGLKDILSDKEAYTYLQNVKIIFIKRSLDAETKLKRLLHEIGHIELDHLYNDVLTTEDKERDAESFVYYAMKNSSRNVLTAIIIVILLLLLVASVAINTIQYLQIKELNELIPDSEMKAKQVEQFYITKTGSKFHKKECKFAATGSPVDKEYAASHYDPCGVCNPLN